MITYLFLSEGTSDEVLVPLINRLVLANIDGPVRPIVPNFSILRPQPKTLSEKLHAVISLYSGIDIIIIHRDADNVGYEARRAEIDHVISHTRILWPYVPLIPVRMTEAWLLTDFNAIHNAIGFGKSKNEIEFLSLRKVEGLADPKAYLLNKIKEIANLPKRRERDLNVYMVRKKIGVHLTNLENLNRLSSFVSFKGDLAAAIDTME